MMIEKVTRMTEEAKIIALGISGARANIETLRIRIRPLDHQ